MDFFQNRNITLVKQAPYSLDLNLLDRWINSKIKDYVRGNVYDNAVDVAEAALQCLKDIPENEYHEQLNKLQRYCQRVVREGGNYVTD